MSTSAVYRFGVRFDGNATQLARAAKEAEDAIKKVGARGMSEFRRMAQAREVLGVKSERDIQREIARTEAAYNRLARSGTLSFREQRMAARAMREEVTRLTNEMGRLTTRQRLAAGARGVAAVGAGVGVATAIIAPRMQRAMEYDMRLASMANTAFSDRDVAGRRAGMRDLDRMVIDAVRYGGGTRAGAADTADALLASGVFKPQDINKILREAVRAGTANSADPAAFAQMAITASQTFGVKSDRMGALFGMGTYAGQQGGFEIRDMAKWLPSQMAAAKSVGMYGEAGFAKLAALNQAAVVTSGTRDEAGNNVVNLLAKLGSQDTNKDFKKQGIDLPGELAKGRVRGIDAIDVLGELLQKQLAKSANYKNVQKQLAGAKNDQERSQALEAVGGIAQGTVIGKVFQDRQALMALYGYMQNRDRVQSIYQGALGNTDAAQRNFELISSTSSYKVQQTKNEAEIAQQHSMDKLTPVIDTLADHTTNLIREYPALTTAIGAATTALIALAGSAATAAILNGGKLGGVGMGALAAGAGRLALGAGGVGVAGLAGYGAGTLLYKGLLEGNAGGDAIGAGIARTLSFFGNSNAGEALNADKHGAVDAMLAGRGGRTVGERLGSGSYGLAPNMLQQDLKGEILLRVTQAPGLSVQAETHSSNSRIPFRTDGGRTNLNAGY